MSGTGLIRFDLKNLRRTDSLPRFLRMGQDDVRKQLCVGYPLLALDGNKVAPLIYCQAAVEQTDQIVTLRPESSTEISYAALKELRFTEEEIGQFLAECNHLLADSRSFQFQVLEDAVIARLRDLLQIDLPRSERFDPYALVTLSGLFWVDANHATAALIEELDVLSLPARWLNTPEPLKHLLSALPEHEYPLAPPFHEDTGTYVTLVNPSQSRAVAAAAIEPLTVITGPPGTGKSQLVLNLIANAYLNGESVLFASYNNMAVNVVMQRLQQQIKFQGAVRTGNKSYREKAAQQIETTLDQLATQGPSSPLSQTRQHYQAARQAAIEAQDELQKIRELKSLLESRQAERQSRLDMLSRTDNRVTKLAQETIPPYSTKETEVLQSKLETLQHDLVSLRARLRDVTDRANGLFFRNSLNDPSLNLLIRFGDQWGTFGEGMLEEKSFKDLPDLGRFLQRWHNLLPALGHLTTKNEADAYCQEQNEALQARTEAVPPTLRDAIPVVAQSCSRAEAIDLTQQLETLEVRLRQIIENRFSPWERFLNFVGARKPLEEAASHYDAIIRDLQLDPARMLKAETDAKSLVHGCRDLACLIAASQSLQAATESQVMVDLATTGLDEAKEVLPESLQDDIDLIPAMAKPTQALNEALSQMVQDANQIQDQADLAAQQLNDLLGENQTGSKMLAKFKATLAGVPEHLWLVKLPARLNAVDRHIRIWGHLLAFWVEDAAVKRLQQQLAHLPDEQVVELKVKSADDLLLDLGGRLLQDTWFDRAKLASTLQVQRARDYAGSPRSDKFASILNLFPIWATTNLAAKPNFPLAASLFDLVIIDEASQCDIPSAIPLLYRAKRAVIIGDPNQLRHIATITEPADLAAAQQSGVDGGGFLYSEQSLFDLAQHSAGNRPGVLLLNEHFRSDSRIISFSNREFYKNSLVIKTDLTKRGLRKQFLNDYGGVYWLHVQGRTVQLRKSSAFNEQELSAVKAVLPTLLQNLSRAHGLDPVTLGVVTPYRAQKDRIHEWLVQSTLTEQVHVGTAHAFQGDERDFIVFSPVLADGISPGSLNWLERTNNLLNVALTRARVALIVIGDWDFCRSLPAENPYRRLADYVVEMDNRLHRKMSDVPLLGGPVLELAGYVVDPHNPEHSRTTLRRFFTSCREYVWWLDSYFNDNSTLAIFDE